MHPMGSRSATKRSVSLAVSAPLWPRGGSRNEARSGQIKEIHLFILKRCASCFVADFHYAIPLFFKWARFVRSVVSSWAWVMLVAFDYTTNYNTAKRCLHSNFQCTYSCCRGVSAPFVPSLYDRIPAYFCPIELSTLVNKVRPPPPPSTMLVTMIPIFREKTKSCDLSNLSIVLGGGGRRTLLATVMSGNTSSSSSDE